jgi:hypothetical protein
MIAFLSVAVEKGIQNGVLGRKMDEVSIEAMLSEAGINWKNARTLFRHMKQFVGRSLLFLRKSDGPTLETTTFLQRWIAKFCQIKPSLATGEKSRIFFCNIS